MAYCYSCTNISAGDPLRKRGNVFETLDEIHQAVQVLVYSGAAVHDHRGCRRDVHAVAAGKGD